MAYLQAETKTETETDKNGLYKIVKRCSYCSETRDWYKFPLDSVHIWSVSVSISVSVSGSVNET